MPAPRRGAARGSPSTATTTSTASCSTAILVRALRTLGADVDWYLPSRIEDGYGLAAPPSSGSPRAARSCWSPSTARSPRSRRSPPRAPQGIDVVVTDHHTPRADGVLPDAPIVHPRVGGYPCPDLCAAASPTSSRWRCGAPTARARTSTSSRWPRSPTACRCVGENRRLVRAGLAALRATAQARPAGADGGRARRAERGRCAHDRLPPRAADQRRRAPAPRRRGARAAADRGPRARRRDRARARRRQRRAPPRRDADPVRGRGAGRRRWPTRPALRARRRRLASGRDRDRRLADRRAPSPPGGADRAARRRGPAGHRLGALDPGVRPAGRPRRVRRAPERHGGHRAAAGCTIAPDRRSTRSAPRSSATPASVLAPEDLVAGRARRRGRRRRRARPRRWPRSSSASRRSARAIPRCRCWSARRGSSTRGRWARASTCASPSSRARRARRRSRSARRGCRRAPPTASTRRSGSSSTSTAAPSRRGSCCATRCAPRGGAIEHRRRAGRPRCERALAELDADLEPLALPVDAIERRGSSTAAATAWPGRWRPSSPRASRCWRSAPTRRAGRRRWRRAWAASPSRRGWRWSATRRSPALRPSRRARPAADRRRRRRCSIVLERSPGPSGLGRGRGTLCSRMSTSSPTTSPSRCAALYRALRGDPARGARTGDAARAAAGCCGCSTSSGSSNSTARRSTRSVVEARRAPSSSARRRSAPTARSLEEGRAWLSQRDPTGGVEQADRRAAGPLDRRRPRRAVRTARPSASPSSRHDARPTRTATT